MKINDLCKTILNLHFKKILFLYARGEGYINISFSFNFLDIWKGTWCVHALNDFYQNESQYSGGLNLWSGGVGSCPQAPIIENV